MTDWKQRNGVGASTLTVPLLAEQPSTLLQFLEQTLQYIPRRTWVFRFSEGLVVNENGQPLAADAPCITGQRIYYWRDAGGETRVPFEEHIIYQDEHIVVADKPHFLPVAPTGRYVQETLLVRLKKRLNLPDLAPIHRIDRDTAGLVLFSVKTAERDAYARLFRERQVHKVYECLAPHVARLPEKFSRRSRIVPSPDHFMQMREVPGEPNSETHIERLTMRGDVAHYRLKPISGKRHQLRVHMSALGAAICNDGIYPVLTPRPEQMSYEHPLKLLAKTLAFKDPISGIAHTWSSARDLL